MEGGAVMSNQEKDIWMYIVIILFFFVITYKDSIAIDSIVVFKDKEEQQ